MTLRPDPSRSHPIPRSRCAFPRPPARSLGFLPRVTGSGSAAPSPLARVTAVLPSGRPPASPPHGGRSGLASHCPSPLCPGHIALEPHSSGCSRNFFFFPLKPPASCHSGVQLCDCPAVASLLPGSGVSFGACVPCFLGRPRGPSRLEACGGQASRVRAHPEASSFTARR